MMKLFLKNSNLFDHNSPTSQTDGRTDGQTDRQTTCDRNTALCTKVHRAVKTTRHIACQRKKRARVIFSMQFRDCNVITSKPTWKLKHTNSILGRFEYFCQMSSKSITIFWAIPFQSRCVFFWDTVYSALSLSRAVFEIQRPVGHTPCTLGPC